jgi:H+-transporting ATPase
MGSSVVCGEVEGTVEFSGAETFFGKTASLLQDTHESTHLQIVLVTIMYVLIGISLVLCAVIFIYLMVKGVSLKNLFLSQSCSWWRRSLLRLRLSPRQP